MAAMNEKDYYAILGVDKGASTDEIRRAFQQKARKLHPDVNKEPDAEERFKEVSEAYAVLSDDDKRRRYDAMRSGVPFAGGAGSAGYGPAAGYGGSASDDPFSWFFGFPFGAAGTYRRQASSSQRSRSYNPKAGKDVSFEVTLDEQTARQGARRSVTYQRYVACESCGGSGSVSSGHPETCPTCSGRGRITVDLSDFFFGVAEMTCPECEGTGKVVANPCPACGGSGVEVTASELVVEIPAGSHDGDVVRLEGKGNAGTNGESYGDFVCRVGVPAEQLPASASFGFRTLGVFFPFFLLYMSSLTLASIAQTLGVTLAIALVIGIVSGGLKHGLYWWRNGARAFAAGTYSSLPIVMFFLAMRACNAVLFAPLRT